VAPEAFATVIARLPGATLLVASDGMIREANASAQQMLQCAPQELRGRHLSDLVAEPPEKLEAFLRACSRSAQPVPGGMTLADATGRRIACRWEGSVLSPRTAEAPALLMVRVVPNEVAVNRFAALNLRIGELDKEVARRRRAEFALREQRELLLVTLSSIGDAVITTDAAGVITFLNRVAEVQTGWQQSEAVGRPLHEVFVIADETTRSPLESPVSKVLHEGRVVGLANHTVLIARDGTTRPIDDSAAPIRDADGKVLGVVLVFHDISERRAAERERTEADRRKDEFLAMLAHELRNPLAVLGNGIEYIRAAHQAAAEDPALGLLGEAMRRQLRQLARLVDDLLDVSRISTGKIVLRKAPVALQDVIQESIATCRPAISARELRLRVALPAERLVVEADPARLSQVFCNLISNAVKFSEPGGRVEITSEAKPGRAVIRVSDAGAGIAAHMLGSVFDMFVQGDNSLARTHGGLGVGLTIARQIAELHGGSIEARSEGPGRGSEFAVSLPLTGTGIPAPAQAAEPARPAQVRHILVVDDNVDAAASLAMLLRMAGHRVEVANDGRSALRLAAAVRPEVVLLDLGMPGMDGYEVASRLRQNPANEGMVLLAVSGYGAEADRRRTRASGFDHHLTKPLEIEALEALVSKGSGA
jgi:PAS domain S-box-containing protein